MNHRMEKSDKKRCLVKARKITESGINIERVYRSQLQFLWGSVEARKRKRHVASLLLILWEARRGKLALRRDRDNITGGSGRGGRKE